MAEETLNDFRKKALDERQREIERREKQLDNKENKDSPRNPAKQLKEMQKADKTNEQITQYAIKKKLSFLQAKEKLRKLNEKYFKEKYGGRGFKSFRMYRQANPKPTPAMMIEMQRRQAQQQEYNRVFPSGKAVALGVEREIMNIGSGAGISGDSEAFAMEKEILGIGNFNFILPVASIERETMFHSNLQHINPINQIESDVNFFGNILNPQARTYQKKKRR